MEPTDHNRRAFDDAHRTSENVLRRPGMPERIRERLHGASGSASSTSSAAAGGSRSTWPSSARSSPASTTTRRRSRPRGGALPELPWVHADVHALPPELLLGRWDLVYLGYGSLRAAARVDAWAGGVAAALRPGGVLLLHDEHPAASVPRRVRPLARRLLRVGRASASSSPRSRGAGLALRGLEEWPGKDANVPGPPRARGREARRLGTRHVGDNRPWESQSASC